MASPDPSRAAPLHGALEREIRRFDLLIARVWTVTCAFGVVLSVFLAATADRSLGIACAVVVGPYLCWFFCFALRCSRGPPSPALAGVNAVIETSTAWVFFVVLLFVQGPGYALASWVPPMIFSLTVFALTVRLQALPAALAGIIGAVAFLALHYWVAAPALPADLAGMVIYQAEVQISRTLSLVGVAFMAALAVRGMRRAINRAEVSARELDLFGKYRLVREIARGGMAVVFEAVYCPEGGFERRVAIKRIHSHLAKQRKFVDLFRSEAEISSRLGHPNIVQVLDFGRVEDKYFLSMEYVDGITLRALMGRSPEPLQIDVVAFVTAEVLAGLAHAHHVARGPDGSPLRVVHRDLCPPNVLLSTNGEVKITDFGVARALRDAGADQTNTVVGHMGYISPEQARGEAVDTRSDLFAAAVVLWELVTGSALFRRDNDGATLAALMYDVVPPASLRRRDLDPAWDEFFDRALDRDPDRRFPTAGAMAGALMSLPGARGPDSAAALARQVRAHRAEPVLPADDADTQLDHGAPP